MSWLSEFDKRMGTDKIATGFENFSKPGKDKTYNSWSPEKQGIYSDLLNRYKNPQDTAAWSAPAVGRNTNDIYDPLNPNNQWAKMMGNMPTFNRESTAVNTSGFNPLTALGTQWANEGVKTADVSGIYGAQLPVAQRQLALQQAASREGMGRYGLRHSADLGRIEGQNSQSMAENLSLEQAKAMIAAQEAGLGRQVQMRQLGAGTMQNAEQAKMQALLQAMGYDVTQRGQDMNLQGQYRGQNVDLMNQMGQRTSFLDDLMYKDRIRQLGLSPEQQMLLELMKTNPDMQVVGGGPSAMEKTFGFLGPIIGAGLGGWAGGGFKMPS